MSSFAANTISLTVTLMAALFIVLFLVPVLSFSV
jgi:hypothetical protein